MEIKSQNCHIIPEGLSYIYIYTHNIYIYIHIYIKIQINKFQNAYICVSDKKEKLVEIVSKTGV